MGTEKAEKKNRSADVLAMDRAAPVLLFIDREWSGTVINDIVSADVPELIRIRVLR